MLEPIVEVIIKPIATENNLAFFLKFKEKI